MNTSRILGIEIILIRLYTTCDRLDRIGLTFNTTIVIEIMVYLCATLYDYFGDLVQEGLSLYNVIF